MRRTLTLAVMLLGACARPGGPYPSLQPRAAESIDPRVQPDRPINDRPVSATLASQLAALVAQARTGDATFAPVMTQAERLAGAAGPRQSESWIAAQEALSAAIAARRATALAAADIDSLAASALQTQGGIAPNDLAAIRGASEQVAAIARSQTDRIGAVKRRLG